MRNQRFQNIFSFRRRAAVTAGSLLLDLYPGALAAYSVKKLRDAATSPGNLRGADNSTLVASFTGEELNEAAITGFFGSQDVFFSSFVDQTGGGLTATQGSAAKQGRIAIAGTIQKQGGQAVLDMLSASQVEYEKLDQTMNAYSVYLRVRFVSGAMGVITNDISVGGGRPVMFQFATIGFRSGTTPNPVSGGANPPSYGYTTICWVRNGVNGTLYVNGTLVGTNSSLNASTFAFNRVISLVANTWPTGQFRSLVVYPTDHNAATVAAISPLL